MRSESRLPALDGLRGYAALVVISVHIYFLGDPAHGVTSLWVFFILSGFLLFRPFVGREFRFGPREVAGYLVKRAFRILPLYYLALLTYRVLGIPPFLGEPSWLAQHLTFARASGHFWTIKQEMIFYLALPLVAVGCAMLRTWWAALAFVVILIPASYVTFNVGELLVLHGGLGGMLLYITPFLCGLALAIVADRLATRWGLPMLAVAVVGLLLLNWQPTATFEAYERLVGLPRDGNPFSHPYLVWPFASALVLGAYLHPSPVFANRVVYGLGVISYGLYVWHGLVANLVVRQIGFPGPWTVYLATVVGSIILGTLTYRWIELPGMRYGHWLASRIARRERAADTSQVSDEVAPATSASSPSAAAG